MTIAESVTIDALKGPVTKFSCFQLSVLALFTTDCLKYLLRLPRQSRWKHASDSRDWEQVSCTPDQDSLHTPPYNIDAACAGLVYFISGEQMAKYQQNLMTHLDLSNLLPELPAAAPCMVCYRMSALTLLCCASSNFRRRQFQRASTSWLTIKIEGHTEAQHARFVSNRAGSPALYSI
jgi:hypothetical protein